MSLKNKKNNNTNQETHGEDKEFKTKRIKKKLKEARLPNKLIYFPNPDKTFQEKWYKGRNPLNIVHSVRFCITGPPSVGKTTVLKNIILRANPPYKEIVVIHCDPGYTKEYDDITDTILTEIPSPDEWLGEVKTLVILEDLEFKGLDKTQKRNLDRLYGYVSSHKNISVALCSQNFTNVPVLVRRCTNFFILWRCPDLDSMNTICRKVGLSLTDFRSLFDEFLTGPKDSLWIDLTEGTPYPLRKNGYEIIERE